MDAFLTPEMLQAAGMVVLGVVLFGLAPYLPSLFPHWFTRMMGFGVSCIALCTLWLLTWSWQAPALLGGAALVAMALIHQMQGRHPVASTEPVEADPPDSSQN
jgi:hypothetical protein